LSILIENGNDPTLKKSEIDSHTLYCTDSNIFTKTTTAEMMDHCQRSSNPIPSSRPRKHSWSRPIRRQNSGIDVENLTPNIVDGTAHIFFSKDKSWFQGNIIEYGKGNVSGSVYKLSGKRIDLSETFDDEKVFSENDIFQLTTNWLPIMEGDNEREDQTSTLSNPHLLKLSKSEAESYSHSPDSQHLGSLGSSGSDYLDSDLVNAAIERLSLDESSASPSTYSRSSSFSVNSPSGCDSRSDTDSSSQKYHIALTEFETGMSYRMEGVYKDLTSSECTIIGKAKANQISFKSKKCFKGNSADMMISRHLGPGFIDQNMSVFLGDIRLRYIDPVINAQKRPSQQWCN